MELKKWSSDDEKPVIRTLVICRHVDNTNETNVGWRVIHVEILTERDVRYDVVGSSHWISLRFVCYSEVNVSKCVQPNDDIFRIKYGKIVIQSPFWWWQIGLVSWWWYFWQFYQPFITIYWNFNKKLLKCIFNNKKTVFLNKFFLIFAFNCC